MKKFLIAVCALTAAAATLVCASCAGKPAAPANTARPSANPTASAAPAETAAASASPDASMLPDVSASPDASMLPEGSREPGETAGPGSTEGENEIDGFMEGFVLDPDDLPEMLRALTQKADYAGYAVQSVTYRLYDGRQAYYVVLQGEGEASHPVYVFADGSVIEE